MIYMQVRKNYNNNGSYTKNPPGNNRSEGFAQKTSNEQVLLKKLQMNIFSMVWTFT